MPAAVKPPSDRRTSIRRPTQLKMPCRLRRATGEGPWNASIRNISADGIGLIANRQYKPNMLLAVELPTKSQAYTAPKLMRVTHARPQPGGKWWIFGGVFASRLSNEDLAGLV